MLNDEHNSVVDVGMQLTSFAVFFRYARNRKYQNKIMILY